MPIEPRDIAVAGTGPAGLAAALFLHRLGHRITLFDRMDKPAPLGSGLILQPTGLAILAELGLDAAVLRRGKRIDRLFGRSVPGDRIVLDVRYAAMRGDRFGLAVHRAALFQTLFEAAQAERIRFETRWTVASAPLAGGGRRYVTNARGGRAGPFDLVVNALGTRSPLLPGNPRPLRYGALWATLDWPSGDQFHHHWLEQRYRRADRMAGVLPIGLAPGADIPKVAFFWSLRGDRFEGWPQRGLEAWKDEVAQLWPQTVCFLDQIEAPEQLIAARYAHRTLAQPAATGIVHIGDAYHSTSPQLGQGANMALLDAMALCRVLDGTSDLPSALAVYRRLRHRHVRLYQAMSFLFTPAYQSDGLAFPLLRDRIVGPLSRVPPAPRILAAIVSGLIGRPLDALGIDDLVRSEVPSGRQPRPSEAS